MLSWSQVPERTLYISGDTVWYEGVAEVAKRFKIDIAVLFTAPRVCPRSAKSPLTMTAEDGVAAARALVGATIAPLHNEGWAPFSETRDVISAAFTAAGLESRLQWLEAAKPITLL